MNLMEMIDSPHARREVDPTELTQAFLDRIEHRKPLFEAVITPTPKIALEGARRVQSARERGIALPLDGMPIVLKDNIDLGGVRSTRGSRFFLEHVAEHDAFVVQRLRDAGAIILGKAQSTELMFALAPHPDIPPSKNPWDSSRIPGASSSGSGAALADDQAVGALGTDTGGSVRIPAAFCGVTGLRPTFGLVSNTGVFHIAASLDTVGPMARSAVAVAELFQVMVGYDRRDPYSVEYNPEGSMASNGRSILRIGVPQRYFFDSCEPDVASAVYRAIDSLEELGHVVVELDLELAEVANEGFAQLIRADALIEHSERLADRPEDFSVDVRDRLRLGEQLTGRDIAAVYHDMAAWKQELSNIFRESVDVIACPTVKCEPPSLSDAKLGKLPDVTALTYPWAFGHVPALSLPSGFSSAGLPIGMQLVGPPHADWLLLGLGRHFQSVTDWHLRRPYTPRSGEGRI